MTDAQRRRMEAMRDGGNRGLRCPRDKATRELIRRGHAFRRHDRLYLTQGGRHAVGLPPCRAVCAWCQLPMGDRPEGEPGTTTHGCCPTCQAGLMQELRA